MTNAFDASKALEPRDGDTRGIRRIRDAADETLQAGSEITEKAAEAAAQTADSLADVTRRAANEGEEAARSGLRAFAAARHRPADTSHAHGRQAAEAERPAFVGCYAQFGRGLVQMQHSYFDVLRRSMEVADLQRDLYWNAVRPAIEASRTVLLTAVQVAQNAMQPAQRRG